MKKIKFGETTKILLIEDETLFKQGETGDKAYMIISGRMSVLVDNIKVGSMSDGEVFGELALLLNQKRSATIVSITPTELIEIDKNGLEQIIKSASANTKKMIYQLCEASFKKRRIPKGIFSESDLMDNLDPENELITKFAKQIFHRLDHSTSHVE